jgi:hypothetical protein
VNLRLGLASKAAYHRERKCMDEDDHNNLLSRGLNSYENMRYNVLLMMMESKGMGSQVT